MNSSSSSSSKNVAGKIWKMLNQRDTCFEHHRYDVKTISLFFALPTYTTWKSTKKAKHDFGRTKFFGFFFPFPIWRQTLSRVSFTLHTRITTNQCVRGRERIRPTSSDVPWISSQTWTKHRSLGVGCFASYRKRKEERKNEYITSDYYVYVVATGGVDTTSEQSIMRILNTTHIDQHPACHGLVHLYGIMFTGATLSKRCENTR